MFIWSYYGILNTKNMHKQIVYQNVPKNKKPGQEKPTLTKYFGDLRCW